MRTINVVVLFRLLDTRRRIAAIMFARRLPVIRAQYAAMRGTTW